MNRKIQMSLLSLRLTVFLVMIMWTLDKFFNPSHASKVFQHFYLINDIPELALTAIATIQMLVVICFLTGFKKKISYGLVLGMHLVSTLSSYQQYINPWENLLFFAAWPMLAACFTLFILREEDTLFTLDRTKA